MRRESGLAALVGGIALLVTEPNASALTREPFALATSPGDERAPAFSPDGGWIAFESNRSGNWDIWRVRPDGTDLENLTRSSANERFPAYSPDGAQLVFQGDFDGTAELYRIPSAGGEPLRLTRQAGAELFPAWSPDGRFVAYTRELDGDFRIETVSLESGEVTPQLAEAGRDLWPRFAPDGRSIAFFSRRATAGADDEIHLLHLADRSVRRITSRLGHDFCPAWLPDGRRLVVAHSPPEGARRLDLIDVDGRLLGAVAGVGGEFDRITEPAVSPDGRLVAFAASRAGAGTMELYTVELSDLMDGGEGAGASAHRPRSAATPFVEGLFRTSEGIVFTPSGELFVTANRALWKVATDGTARQLARLDSTVGLALDPNGQLLVADFGPKTRLREGANDDGVVWRYERDAAGGGSLVAVARTIPDPNAILVMGNASLLVSDDFDHFLWMVSPKGEVERWSDAIPFPNGLALSRDGSTLYVAQIFESLEPLLFADKVWALPLAEGRPAGAPRILFRSGGAGGMDGLILDAKGRLIVAEPIAGRVWRIDPTSGAGEVLAEGLGRVLGLALGIAPFDAGALYATQGRGGTIFRIPLPDD